MFNSTTTVSPALAAAVALTIAAVIGGTLGLIYYGLLAAKSFVGRSFQEGYFYKKSESHCFNLTRGCCEFQLKAGAY